MEFSTVMDYFEVTAENIQNTIIQSPKMDLK